MEESTQRPGGSGGAPIDSAAVSARTGELTWPEIDLFLRGIGIDFQIKRTYHSALASYPSEYGAGWEMNTHRRLEVRSRAAAAPQEPTSFRWSPGNGPTIGLYDRNPSSAWFTLDSNEGKDPGAFEYLPASDQFRRYEPSGLKEIYTRLSQDQEYYYLTRIEDHKGNGIDYFFEPTHYTYPEAADYRLDEVVDTVGRTIDYQYDSGDNGRLSRVVVLDGQGATLGQVDYEYEDVDDVLVLKSVQGLEVAMEGAQGALSFQRPVRSYEYDVVSLPGAPYDSALLRKVVSARQVSGGEHPILREWIYENPSGSSFGWRVHQQIDGPGTGRAGTHSYTYSSAGGTWQTNYQGPEGELREFYYNAAEQLWKRRDNLDPSNNVWAETLWEYDSNCACSRIKKVIYPDGKERHTDYDAAGNPTAVWYRASGSDPVWRVERFEWTTFDPQNGDYFVLLSRYEPIHNAAVEESPGQRCNDPACGGTSEVPGHVVYLYYWDEGSSTPRGLLTRATFDSIQNRIGAGAVHHAREQQFFYDPQNRYQLQQQLDKVDGVVVREITTAKDPAAQAPAFLTLETAADPVSNETWTTSYALDEWGRVLKQTTPDGVVTRTLRDDAGNTYKVFEDWKEATQSALRTTSRFFDAGELLVKEVVAAQGQTQATVFVHDDRGSLVGWNVTGSDGVTRTWSRTLDKNGLTLTETDYRGFKVSTVYGFGSYRLPIRVSREFGGTTQIVWEVGNGMNSSGYDVMGRLVSWRNAAGWKSYRTYDEHGRPKESFSESYDQGGTLYYQAARLLYGNRGYVKEIESGTVSGNPLDATRIDHWQLHTQIKTNTVGDVLSVSVYRSGSSEPLRVTDRVVDGLSRPVREVTLHGDRVLGLANAKQAISEQTYDALDRPITVVSKLGEATTLTHRSIDYQEVLRKVETVLTEGGRSWKSVAEFDALGRTIGVTEYDEAQAANRVSSTEYGGFDEVRAVVDPLGLRKEWSYDGLGRITEERLLPSGGGAPQVTSYSWNPTSGVLDSVTDAEGSVTSFEYYPAQFLLPKKVLHPDGRWTEVAAYDVLDRPVSVKNSRNLGHNFTYNRGYLIDDSSFVIDPAPPLPANTPNRMEWLYDPAAGILTESRVWNGGGSPLWRTQFDFNELGELESEVQGPDGATLAWGWSYGYAGEVQKTVYPPNLGLSVGEFEYDEALRPSGALYKAGQAALSNYAFGYQGARFQARTEDSQAQDTRLQVGYDAWGRVNSLLWGTWTGGTTFQAIDGQERAYDLADRVVARQRFIDGVGEVFVHDGFGRMQAWYQGVPNALNQAPNTAPSSWTKRTQYMLDDVFARTEVQVEVNGQAPSTTTYASNAAHFYTQVTAPGGSSQTRVSSHGLLADDGTYLFYYDPWDRLTEVRRKSDGVLLRRFIYDAEGRRVRTLEENGQTTRMTYWGSRLAASYVEGTTRTNVYTYGYTGGADGESFVRITQVSASVNGVYQLVRDFQGSVLALALPDGTVVERYRYSPFGEVTIENPQGQVLAQSVYGFQRFFLGRPYDAVTGLYDVRARWYDPKLGVFLSPDPLGPVDGWNLFTYVLGTPATLADSFGLWSNQDPYNYGAFRYDRSSTTFCGQCHRPGQGGSQLSYSSFSTPMHLSLNATSIALDSTVVGAQWSWAPDLADAGLSFFEGDWIGAGISVGAATPILGNGANAAKMARVLDEASDGAKVCIRATDAARGGARSVDDLVKAAQSKFPGKAGKVEQHHVTPKYLGGDPKGPTVPIDAAYHQEITNAFRAEWGYGKGRPSEAQLRDIMQRVYERFPLPGQ